MMIGTSLCDRIRRHTSVPSILGSMMSKIILREAPCVSCTTANRLYGSYKVLRIMTLILSCLKRSLCVAETVGEAFGHLFHGVYEIHCGGEPHRPGVRPAPSQVSADDPCLVGSLSVG